MRYTENFSARKLFTTVALAMTGVIGSAAACSATVITGETDRGIDYRLGEMTTQNAGQLRKPGLSFKTPFITSVEKVSVAQREKKYEKLQTYTKDNQLITADLAVLYKLSESELVRIYKTNPDFETKLENAVLDAAKSALGKQEAQNIAQNRAEIMVGVTKETAAKVKTLLGIDVIAVQMPNFDFDDNFDHAVAAAANAKAVLSQKQTELQQQEVEKKKTIVNADARAAEQKAKTDADAYSTQEAAKAAAEAAKSDAAARLALSSAEAEGFNKIAASIGRDKMGIYLQTQKWNGAYPQVVANGGGATTVVPLPAMK